MINNNQTKMTTEELEKSQLSNIRHQIFKPDNIISLALEHTKDQILTEYEFAKLMNFTDKEVDMLKVYWNPIFNHNWIYLSDELILGNLTNETKKDAIRHFYDRILLKGDFQEGFDYKEISPSDGLVNLYSPKYLLFL